MMRNIAAWRARAIVMMDAVLWLLFGFIDGIERWHVA